MTPFHFEISGTIGPDGQIELAYLRFTDADVAKTVELDDDRLLADYDSIGALVGIEILAPFRIGSLQSVLPANQLAAVERALPDVLKAA